jgi:hypothetical protein
MTKPKRTQKKVARPRVLWHVNPLTQVVPSARKYRRNAAKRAVRAAADEQENRR